jgi:hypothetical protein
MIVTRLEEAASHLVVPDLATLQRILDEICDGGDALAQWMGEPAGGEVSQLISRPP